MKIRSILALTDLSVDADRAVRRAARLAAEHGAELRLVYLSGTTPEPDADPLPRLHRRARRLARRHGLAVDVSGSAAASADDVARFCDRADLIVLHDRRRSSSWRWLRGRGLAERLAAGTGRPVLAVRQSSSLSYSRVTVGLDLCAGSAAVLEQACRLAPGARIDAFHVLGALRALGLRLLVSAPHVRGARMREARRRTLQELKQLAARENARDDRVAPAIGFGAVARGILERQLEAHASLLVVGVRRQARFAGLPLASVARGLLDEAGCDVLLVPAPAACTRRTKPAPDAYAACVAGRVADTG